MFILIPVGIIFISLIIVVLLRVIKHGALLKVLIKLKKSLVYNAFLKAIIVGYLGYCFNVLVFLYPDLTKEPEPIINTAYRLLDETIWPKLDEDTSSTDQKLD